MTLLKMPKGMSFTNHTNTDIVARQLNEYRNDTRYLYKHFNGSVFQNIVPYKADPSIWLDYYGQLEMFIRLIPHARLFEHARVTLVCKATREEAVYKMFVYNTPYTIFDMTMGFRFRLLFV